MFKSLLQHPTLPGGDRLCVHASGRFDDLFFSKASVRFLIQFVSRMPRASLLFVLVTLIAIAGCSAYAGILVIESIAHYLDTSRFAAGLLLSLLFLRLPSFREGKLRTRGLLPAQARLPLMAVLLALCLVDYGSQGKVVEAVFIGLAMGILLVIKAIRTLVASRISGFFTKFQQPSGAGPAAGPAKAVDSDVIDVDFREKKD